MPVASPQQLTCELSVSGSDVDSMSRRLGVYLAARCDGISGDSGQREVFGVFLRVFLVFVMDFLKSPVNFMVGNSEIGLVRLCCLCYLSGASSS